MTESAKKQKFHFGDTGSQSALKQIIQDRGVGCVLLVRGGASFETSGASAWLEPCLSGLSIHEFRDFSVNPNLKDLQKGLEVYRDVNPDLVLGVGGGTVLDMAKLLTYFGDTGIDPDLYIQQKVSGRASTQYLVAIPTTAGTGSEATHFAVLYKDKVKYSVSEEDILPDVAIVNPALSSSMSSYLTACTGADAFVQAIESFWAVQATDTSKKYAKKAIRLSLHWLRMAALKPSEESRARMAEAAYWSGRAINISKTTACHALSYPLTSYFDYPHGHAVAIFLPAIFELHQKRGVVSSALMHLFSTKNPKKEMLDLFNLLELRPREAMSQPKMDLILSNVNADRLKNNPVGLTEFDLKKVVSVSLSGNQWGDERPIL